MSELTIVKPVILIADDCKDLRELYVHQLSKASYHTIEAADGFEAVRLAQLEVPDLILMDLAMPVLDGLAAIAHIRKDSKIATVPIIAISAFDEAGTRHKAFTAGVNDYLTKPVSFDRLQCAITRLLKAA